MLQMQIPEWASGIEAGEAARVFAGAWGGQGWGGEKKLLPLRILWPVPGGSDSNVSACNAGRPGFHPQDWEDSPGEGKGQTNSSALAWRKSHGQRSVVGLQSMGSQRAGRY